MLFDFFDFLFFSLSLLRSRFFENLAWSFSSSSEESEALLKFEQKLRFYVVFVEVLLHVHELDQALEVILRVSE